MLLYYIHGASERGVRRIKVAGSDFGPNWNGERCGAFARTTGKPCQAPVVTGKKRCRMHGGAKGSGGQQGERNGAYKHGQYTKEAIAIRKDWMASARALELWRRQEEREAAENVEVVVEMLIGRQGDV